MAKIVSILRKNGHMEGVPSIIIVGQPIADGGAVVEKILYREYKSDYFFGPHFQVDFKDAPTKVVIPAGAVLEILYEVQKKEKVEVPALG